MRDGNYRGPRHARWPHFDERGPDHYYDDDPWDGRGSGGRSGSYFGRPQPVDFQDDSDIYEDEFGDPGPYPAQRRYSSEFPWPEDEYYENRRMMREDRYHPENGYYGPPPVWRRFWRRENEQPAFPPDRNDHGYGRDISGRNGNRGRYPERSLRYDIY